MKLNRRWLLIIVTHIYLIVVLVLPGCIQTPLPNEEDPMEPIVVEADVIVLGTITNRQEIVAEPNTYTMYTLSVEKVIKGKLEDKEIIFTKEGGLVSGGLVEQFPWFTSSDRLLVCLDRQDINLFRFRQNGLFWMSGKMLMNIGLNEVICQIIEIMRKNKITISLPANEIPCLPQ